MEVFVGDGNLNVAIVGQHKGEPLLAEVESAHYNARIDYGVVVAVGIFGDAAGVLKVVEHEVEDLLGSVVTDFQGLNDFVVRIVVHRVVFEQLAQNPRERPAIVTLQRFSIFNIFCHKRLSISFLTTEQAEITGRKHFSISCFSCFP